MQQGVGHIALGIDHQGRNAVQGGLFQQVDAQAGLARAGHADHDRMGGQVSRVVEQRLVGSFVLFWVEDAA